MFFKQSAHCPEQDVKKTSASAIALLAVMLTCSTQARTTSACATACSAGAVYNSGSGDNRSGVNVSANRWGRASAAVSHGSAGGAGQPGGTHGGVGAAHADGHAVADDGGGDEAGSRHPPAPAAGAFLFSPYKDVTLHLDWKTSVMRTAVGVASPVPVVGSGSLVASALPNLSAITLAFASGECGSETWGGVAPDAFARANIPRLVEAHMRYVISTGGQAGSFTCGSNAGMAKFLSRYASPYMVGIDFDLESGKTPAQINDLISRAAYAYTLYPHMRLSFTLATLAASDGSYRGVNDAGDAVVRAIKASGLSAYTINLMVMDLGGPSAGVCVVTRGKCDMGQSAIQAATNLQHTYGIPADHIELTPMIGVNDVVNETFTLSDVDTLVTYALRHGLAGVHMWSLDRDTPCASERGSASPTCNSLNGSTPLQFSKRFLHDLTKYAARAKSPSHQRAR